MSYPATKCFLLVKTDPVRGQLALRRWTKGNGWKCADGYHHAERIVGEVEPVPYDGHHEDLRGSYWGDRVNEADEIPHDDPRWPTTCVDCGCELGPAAEFHYSVSTLWRRTDTGEVMTLRDAPPGAMWDAEWYHDLHDWCGYDGRAMVAKTPSGGEWNIDGRASNCTMPDDTRHRCWIRHGDPPELTVDKSPEQGQYTCQAGGGSIVTDDYHGFLRDGWFTPG